MAGAHRNLNGSRDPRDRTCYYVAAYQIWSVSTSARYEDTKMDIKLGKWGGLE